MAKYALTSQTLSGFTKMTGRNTLKAAWTDDKVAGLRRLRFKWADVCQAVLDTTFQATGTATALALADTLAVLPVLKGELAEWASIYIIKGDATTGTIVAGDSATPAGWSGTATVANQTKDAALDPKSSCTTGGFNIGAANLNVGGFGKLYTADDAVCLTFGTAVPVVATANGIVEVVLKYTTLFPNARVAAGAQ